MERREEYEHRTEGLIEGIQLEGLEEEGVEEYNTAYTGGDEGC